MNLSYKSKSQTLQLPGRTLQHNSILQQWHHTVPPPGTTPCHGLLQSLKRYKLVSSMNSFWVSMRTLGLPLYVLLVPANALQGGQGSTWETSLLIHRTEAFTWAPLVWQKGVEKKPNRLILRVLYAVKTNLTIKHIPHSVKYRHVAQSLDVSHHKKILIKWIGFIFRFEIKMSLN